MAEDSPKVLVDDSDILNELKVSEDIRHSLNIYDIDDLDTIDEINEGLNIMSDLCQNYRHVHVILKNKLGVVHREKYPDYDVNVDKLTNFLKSLRKRKTILKKDGIENSENEKRKDLAIREDTLNLKIQQLNYTVDINLVTDTSFLEYYIEKMEAYTCDYFDLRGVLKNSYGEKYIDHTNVDRITSEISQDIKMAKILKQKLIKVYEVEKRSHFENKKKSRQICKAQNLSKEISLRCDALETKFRRELKNLSDYQILEISRDKSLNVEFNSILEKITNLSTLVVEGGDVVQDLLASANAKRDIVVILRQNYHQNLQRFLTDRDITPDKLKNASTLRIELPKFSGYDSKIDFFSFKSEFQKLIEPTVQNKYLAEYLKRNYLSGSALNLVEKEKDYDKIWERLLGSYGNARLMLQNKLSELDKVGGLWKFKSEEKIADALASLINVMKDLSSLAAEHDIEGQLYEGGGLEKIMLLMGNYRHKKFRSQNLNTISKKIEWENLLKFLKKELQLRERLALDSKTAQLMGLESKMVKSPKDVNVSINSANFGSQNDGLKCSFCDEQGHAIITTAKGNKIIPYYVCEKFVKLSAAKRLEKMNAKKLCTGCLYPGAIKGPKHKCYYLNYCCPHESHKGIGKIHVLLCEIHKNEAANVAILEKFKEKFIKNCKITLPQYSKGLSCFSESVGVAKVTRSLNTFSNLQSEPDIAECAIFQLQTIEVEGVTLNLFFDNGCGDMIVRKSAVDKLKKIGRAKQIVAGPLEITGVGDKKSICDEGVYSICLPLCNGNNATLTGLCLSKVTSKFPLYDLGAVVEDLKNRCRVQGGPELVNKLPAFPNKVGGDTDILIGIRYNKYLPKMIFACDDGFGIYESAFKSPCGSTGILGGPHKNFSKIEEEFRGMYANKMAYFHETLNSIRGLSLLSMSMPLLGEKAEPKLVAIDEPICCAISGNETVGSNLNSVTHSNDVPYCGVANVARRPPKCVRQYDEVERAGTDVTYRCVDCRGCLKCKNGERFDAISIQEEIEQNLIERAIKVIPEQGVTISDLPFVVEPDSRLVPNEKDAMKVYRSQVNKLNESPEDKLSVLESEEKLQELGFVDYVSNLNEEEKKLILEAIVRYFIPWRAVWNEKSTTTPCRLVFDASQGTKGGCSLNSLLAKGANGMNKLVEITLRWLTRRHAFHTDVSKMYNAVRLNEKYWRYQLYLWSPGLEKNIEPSWKVIKTLIYGVRSSGNLAECGLRRTAKLSSEEFPDACDIIISDTYVDDCVSGTGSLQETLKITDEMQVILAKGGFKLKGFSMSGDDPPDHLSSDKESVLVGGLKWFPKGDFLKLNVKELNFSKRIRGKKCAKSSGVIPDVLTKRDCVSIVSEIFDITGKIAPLTGGFKLDISVLHKYRLDWDDPIPNELKEIWASNFDLIKEIGNLQFRRAVIPENALSLDVETIDTADAGENLICAAIYARYKLRGGGHSCQLIFARTKVVHDLTIPRAELAAALLNASTGHVVRLSLKNMLKKSWKITDSQVTLHWINCTKLALKMWVRNRVLEIIRLSDWSNWYYVSSKNMIADIGTRKGAKIGDVGPDSPWIQGYPWMREDEEKFPLKTVSEIVLSFKEHSAANKEKVTSDLSIENVHCLVTKYVPSGVGVRYKFSNYLIDPNRHRFSSVVRILASVFLFLKKINIRNKPFNFLKKLELNAYPSDAKGAFLVFAVNPTISNAKVAVVQLSEDLLNAAKMYYFKKATLEVKQFVSAAKYEHNSVLKNEVLYYTGRILSTQKINGKFSFGDACIDLSAGSFCVPITDSLSPIAYAVVMETHWYSPDVSHGGVEAVLRISQGTAYIIEGRALVKGIKKGCAKCRLLHKKGVRVAMGQIGDNNLCIAPPFYNSQVDICGPFNAYSPVNKRASLKVWFVVFCCTTTGAVDCRVMENYTTDAFVLAFVRFSCRFGYPKLLMPDEGSQLVKGCQDMILSFSDIHHKISVEYGVDFETCPVGAHYVHGKVERKIQNIKRSLVKNVDKNRLSILQWETLGQQIANSINNMPIGLRNKCELLENLDILTPNRLILGRNNNRNPTIPLKMSHDLRRIIESNNAIVKAWFKEWLISYVPLLLDKPKWFVNDRDICEDDVVLFLKSEQEFDRQYQYGIVVKTIISRDGSIRVVEIEYQNSTEKFKRKTKRGVRDIVVVHPVDELGISRELQNLANMMV